MSKIRSDIWCAAFIRSQNSLGNFCVVAKKGHESAGQIWIEIDHLNNSFSLFSPAPMLKYDAEEYIYERVFEKRLDCVLESEIRKNIEKELNFDPDIWVIALEKRDDDIGIKII